MRRNVTRCTAASLAMLLAISDSSMSVLANGEINNIAKIGSPVLITEVIPNTDNLGGLDAYEYYELTNISDSEIILSDYHIVYVNGKTQTLWDPDVEKLPAHSSMLVWMKNDGNATVTKEDFCNYYGISNNSNIVELECGGLHNSGPRTLAVATSTGNVLTTVTYEKAGSSDGSLGLNEAIAFAYNGNESVANYDRTPTPLTVEENEICGVYQAAELVKEPMVTATKISVLEENTTLEIEVMETNLEMEAIISGTIIIDDETTYDLTFNEGKLTGSVPFADLMEKESFTYTVRIFDGINTATTKAQTVRIGSSQAVDQTKTPSLVITELLPDSSNVNGGDGYEFIEIYNNSNVAINLKDYKLNYLYPDTGVSVVWWETNEDKVLNAGETLVFWVDNGANSDLKLEDFNKKFGCELTEEKLIQIECGGMANGSRRGMNITTNTGVVIDSVIYNDNVDNTNADQSITYQNQYADGIFTTVLTGDTQTPTPGTIVSLEKPMYSAEIVTPEQKPEAKDLSATEFGNDTTELVLSVKATSNETNIKTVKLFLKYNEQESFESYNLVQGEDDTYSKALNNVDLLNKRSFTYYFSVSDGFETVTTEVTTISNVDAEEIVQLNVNDGDTVTDTQQIIAYGDQLSIDGTDVTENVEKSINGFGKIAFEATDTDVFFKNAVAVNGEVVGIFNEGTYSDVVTYVYNIDASQFDAETKTITVEFHAGNKANVLEHNIENNDDFTIQNIRMVLPNGKTLTPVSYQAKKGLGTVEHDNMDLVEKIDLTVASQETAISMGDGTSKTEILYVTFELNESDFEAIRYMWDTTQEEDGIHTISNREEIVTVTVDNTAPEIATNIEDGETYHSETIKVTATDALSNEVTMVVLLDGKTIDVPYAFRALEMQAGEHILSINARDEVGNSIQKEMKFYTPKESATIENNVSPENGSSVTTDPTLSVTVTDESNDEMTVTFKTGERYVLEESNITTDTGISNVSGSIEKVFEKNTGNGFSYESFAIELDDTVNDSTIVSIEWIGTSNNAKTFMYVYNTSSEEWEKVENVQQMIDGTDMIICGEISLKDHLDDNCVRVIVQNGEGYTPTQYAAADENNTESSIDSEVTENMEESTESEATESTEESTESETTESTEESTESEVTESTEESTENEVTESTEESAESETIESTENNTEISTQSEIAVIAESVINETDSNTPTYNIDDTARSSYDFTFVIESDTQYYNEDYDGNPDQTLDGVYQHQLNIHNWIIANRERMNIQYVFHDGDIIDDAHNIQEWEQADAAYKLLDKSGIAYGVLAGNHDVGHLDGSYNNYYTYFGENRYVNNAWYGESYKNNRGHYDLISVGGIDFIMVYMGWGIGDEEIDWLNDVLSQYPERKAILNFHEYLLASGGLGEEPQRIHDEVVAVNENVCMVLSGHYHNARTTTDTFVNEDGTTRTVYNMLFDYQGLLEGGAGYMRLMHFDLDEEKVIIRTYTPSYGGTDINNYGDYDAKTSENPNEGNAFVIEGAELNDAEHFEISFADLGITSAVKTLETTDLTVNIYKDEIIGTVENVESGTKAAYVWKEAMEGINGWYAEVTDENGGLSRTNVYYVNVNRDTEVPVLTVEENTTIQVGDTFDEMEGVSATDKVDGDLTEKIIVTGKVNTSIAGVYELIYEVTDKSGNSVSVTRTVEVKAVVEEGGPLDDDTTDNDTTDDDTTDNDVTDNDTTDNDTIEKEEVTSPKTGVATNYAATTGLSAILMCLAAFFKKFKK